MGTKRAGYEIVGHIAVDAGMLWLSDLCRVFGTPYWGIELAHREPIVSDWAEFLDKTGYSYKSQIEYAKRIVEFQKRKTSGASKPAVATEPLDGCELPQVTEFTQDRVGATVGLAIRTRFGDGYFPVEAKRDSNGLIEEIRIKF